MKEIITYKNKNALVIGLGKSGVNAAKLLKKLGANVVVNDKNTPKDLREVSDLENLNIKVVTGSHPLELLDGIDLIVKNPGIPYSNNLVSEAVKRKIKIITEVELAYEIFEGQLIAVTGTNGKTTTTMLITLMLKKEKEAFEAGNIGIPASKVALKANRQSIMVAELSSFQLLGITKLHPHIAVLTNIYEAHLDYHGNRKDYIDAKMKITMNQTQDDYFVVNWDNEEWRKLSKRSQAKIIPFSFLGLNKDGAYVFNDSIYYKDQKIISIDEVLLLGSHNIENVLAAIVVAKLMGIKNENIISVLKSFTGVRHRMQYVTTISDRKFYNDSKATNIEATEKALMGFKNPVVLLAGGLDRGFKFDELIPYFKNLRGIVLFGETADLLVKVAKKAGVRQIAKVKNVVDAVEVGFFMSEKKDVILLSPACASWDQWPNFEVRGDEYIKAVLKLRKSEAIK